MLIPQAIHDTSLDLWDALADMSRARPMAYRTDSRWSIQQDYEHVLIAPRPNGFRSRGEIDLTVAFDQFKYASADSPFKTVPLIAANMDGVGTFEMARAACRAASHYSKDRPFNEAPISVALRKHYTTEEIAEHFMTDPSRFGNAWITIGVKEHDFDRLSELMSYMARREADEKVGKICIDTPNGYAENLLPPMVERVREAFPNMIIMAGNVVDKTAVRMLDDAGADIIKVGIGPGSVCTTRKMTGVGRPQLSSVIETSREARRRGVMVCADGGCVTPGDIAKAFTAGANFVMLGGMVAGTRDGAGPDVEIITTEDGREVIEFYGSSSTDAMKKNSGGVDPHRSSEGKKVRVPLKGTVEELFYGNEGILGALRSTATYIGAANPSEFYDQGRLQLVHKQLNESLGPAIT